MTRFKIFLLACAATGVVGASMLANQGYGSGLHGMFQSSGASLGQYLAPQSWQE